MKILLVLGIIFSIFVIGTALLLRYVKNLFGIKSFQTRKRYSTFSQSSKEDVLYKNDEIVVLKGDAKNH